MRTTMPPIKKNANKNMSDEKGRNVRPDRVVVNKHSAIDNDESGGTLVTANRPGNNIGWKIVEGKRSRFIHAAPDIIECMRECARHT